MKRITGKYGVSTNTQQILLVIEKCRLLFNIIIWHLLGEKGKRKL